MISHLLSNINWFHVIAAAAAYFILGALWYSPVLFARPWAKMVNIKMNDPNEKKGMGAMMARSFILMLVATIGLAIIYQIIRIDTALLAVKFGLFFGVFFAATGISISFIYEKKPIGLHFIDGGYHIAGLIVASLVLVLWK